MFAVPWNYGTLLHLIEKRWHMILAAAARRLQGTKASFLAW
jgi:hypothetical protein